MVQTRLQPSPIQQQPIQQQPIQAQPMQAQPMQTQPMQMQPVQTQPIPLGVQGGQSVFQNQVPPMGQPAAVQPPTGMNVGQPNMGQPNTMVQPDFRVAAIPGAQPPITQPPVTQPPVTQPLGTQPPVGQTMPLQNSGGMNQTPFAVPSGAGSAGQVPPPGMMHMGRAEPAHRIVPFFLNPAEQQELDAFLARWERYSVNIRQYEVEFYLLEFEPDPATLGTVPNQPQSTLFGHFKYNSKPMRYLMAIEGEWRDNTHVKRDGDKNPHIRAEKTIIDEETVYKYDYNSKTVHKVNVPPELIGKGIADSPLPLIFGAKADELKKRFSMKVEHRQDGFVVLYARPLLIEDQQEFRELEVMLDKDLRARGLRQYDINGTGYKVFDLRSVKINPVNLNPADYISRFFNPRPPLGWKQEERNWVQHPPSAPATPQMPMGNAPQHVPPQQPGVPLYRGL